jgi:hypothetical protein
MGQGLGAVFPIVVVGVVANFLMQLLLHLEIVVGCGFLGRFRHGTTKHLGPILGHPGDSHCRERGSNGWIARVALTGWLG